MRVCERETGTEREREAERDISRARKRERDLQLLAAEFHVDPRGTHLVEG